MATIIKQLETNSITRSITIYGMFSLCRIKVRFCFLHRLGILYLMSFPFISSFSQNTQTESSLPEFQAAVHGADVHI